MSTLVIVRKGNRAAIAADSLSTENRIKIAAENILNHQKILKIKDAYIGFTGWAGMHNIFESIIERYPREWDFRSRKHIFETFRILHRKLKEDYFIETREEDDQPVESSQTKCLILSPGGIFEVNGLREVTEYKKFWANGSGSRFALGAMHSVYEMHDAPDKIALVGVEAGCSFDEHSAMPSEVFSLDLKTS
jgi:ATP-dependent protease HslVU (ClpYQ) peptidase subunit